MMKIVPITFSYAKQFVKDYHRHNPNVTGCKFCIGCQDGDEIVGVAICGRPVSRYLDNGRTLEINRVCTNGVKNACSMLYGACCRIAREMGYEKVITYTLQSENGASVRASNFVCDGEAGGTHWTGKRDRGQQIPNESEVAQRFMNDLISRQAVMIRVREYMENPTYTRKMLMDELNYLPSAQPERKKGEWIIDEDCEGKSRTVTCNLCGYEEFNWHNPNFCSNCGADMRGEQE